MQDPTGGERDREKDNAFTDFIIINYYEFIIYLYCARANMIEI